VGPPVSAATREPAPGVAPFGILKMQVKAPGAVAVIVDPANVPTLQLTGVIAIPWNASVSVDDATKPVPVTVTLTPTNPLVGLSGEMVQAVTV